MLINNQTKFKKSFLIFVFASIPFFKNYATSEETLIKTQAILEIYKKMNKDASKKECKLKEDLKNSKLTFDESMVKASNFSRNWTSFQDFSHLYPQKDAEEDLKKYKGAYTYKKIDVLDSFEITDCKIKYSFDPEMYLVLKNLKDHSVYLMNYRDFSTVKKTVKNDYFLLYDSLMLKKYNDADELLQKLSWDVAKEKTLNILHRTSDEKILDLILKNKLNIPVEHLFSLQNSILIIAYPKFVNSIPKEDRVLLYMNLFNIGSGLQYMKYYEDIKKEHIPSARWPKLIADACTSDDYLAKLEKLKSMGFKLNETGERNETAFHIIFQFKSDNIENCTKQLLKSGLDINSADVNGNTPLHLASMVFDKKKVDFLLSVGASPSRKNKLGIEPRLEF